MCCPITNYTHLRFYDEFFKVFILPYLPMLPIITIKHKSKTSLVNFISKAHLTAFEIFIYMEIIEVEYFYIFVVICISSVTCNSYLLLLLLCAPVFLIKL